MKPSQRQRGLPLTRQERFGALDAIDHAAMGLRRAKWNALAELCKQIELCGQRDGCYAYVATLAERMKVSKRTFQRYCTEAEELGLVTRESRHNLAGQQSNHWSVNWDAITARAEASNPDFRRIVETVTPPCQTVTPPCQVVTPNRGTASTTTSPSVSGRLRATGEKSIEQPQAGQSRREALEARAGRREAGSQPDPSNITPDPHVAAKFLRAIGGRYSPRDAALGWKLAALSSVLGEAWLWGIAEAVRAIGPTRPWAYVWRVAAEGSHERPGPGEVRLRRLLVRCSEPPAGWPVRQAGPDFSRRLCVASAED